MTVHARSDVAAVSISSKHGGCGEVHSRPVIGGAPAKSWSLTCHGGCEGVLRNDPHWSTTLSTVPETPDEISIREEAEKRGQVQQAKDTASALQEIAKLGDLPAVLAQLLANNGNNAQALTTFCKHGHQNVGSTRFCGECGVSMVEAPTAESVAINDAVVGDNYDTMSINELRTLARERGIEAARTKKDIIAQLRGGVGV